ncbi:hypothetical protein HHK36_005898 [Tetracentron sinense]|uniref:GPI-anchored protein LLG1-like domain-containing protein n=1 Tax=Tetracentron sinense TaxID=13715 RepID=A0A835DR23_TETSI|nr:hypothetical protein HHK36_005898 [Tetracentron sinense]
MELEDVEHQYCRRKSSPEMKPEENTQRKNYSGCSVNFEFLNYTIITSQCKGPQYLPKLCCTAFKEFACPYADQLNDLTNDCASTMFSYINLFGKYPPGLFAKKSGFLELPLSFSWLSSSSPGSPRHLSDSLFSYPTSTITVSSSIIVGASISRSTVLVIISGNFTFPANQVYWLRFFLGSHLQQKLRRGSISPRVPISGVDSCSLQASRRLASPGDSITPIITDSLLANHFSDRLRRSSPASTVVLVAAS